MSTAPGLEACQKGLGRIKLAGVIKWGEIEINRSHVELLQPLLELHGETVNLGADPGLVLPGHASGAGVVLYAEKIYYEKETPAQCG